MNTDDLINKLSADLKPVKPMISPLRLVGILTMIGSLLIGAGFLVMTLRADLKEQLMHPRFFFEMSLSFLLAICALILAAYLSRPGRDQAVKKWQMITAALLAITFFYDVFRVIGLNQDQILLGSQLSGLECFSVVFGYSVMLGGALMAVIRQGASINPKFSGLVIATACVAFGNIAITFFCGIENGMHIFLWHFTLPLMAALISGALTSRVLLKW